MLSIALYFVALIALFASLVMIVADLSGLTNFGYVAYIPAVALIFLLGLVMFALMMSDRFNAFRKGVKTYYYNSCKTCRNKEVKQRRLEERAAGEADTMWTEHGAIPAARLHEHIRAAQAACPILGFSLWTGDTPQMMGAW